MSSLILDLAVILIFLLFLIAGYKDGVIKSFVGLISFAVASVASVYLADILVKFTYSSFIQPAVVREIDDFITHSASNLTAKSSFLPQEMLDWLRNCAETYMKSSHNMDNGITNISSMVAENCVKPVFVAVFKPGVTVVLMVVSLFLTRFLTAAIIKVLNFSVFKRANSLLGAVFGVFKGYLMVSVFMFCIQSAVALGRNDPGVFSRGSIEETQQNIENTMIFKMIYDNNPVCKFFQNI